MFFRSEELVRTASARHPCTGTYTQTLPVETMHTITHFCSVDISREQEASGVAGSMPLPIASLLLIVAGWYESKCW
jgi:hypothetical protein